MLGQPIVHPSAWRADDMRARPQEWAYELTPADIAELEEAVAAAEATGKDIKVRAWLRAESTWGELCSYARRGVTPLRLPERRSIGPAQRADAHLPRCGVLAK